VINVIPATSEIHIRLAEPPDAAAIANVLYKSFAEYEPLYTQQGFAATSPGADPILDRMREGPVWLALSGVKVLGTVAAVLRGRSAYMRGMAVLPTSRGMRIGSRLLEYVENWASSQGCSRVFLSTTPYLAAAIRLYETFGFRPTDEGPHDLFGTPLFTMEKHIVRKG